MPLAGFSAEDIKSFISVFDDASVEARNRGLAIPDMLERLLAAAREGERDPHKLKAAVLDPGRIKRRHPFANIVTPQRLAAASTRE